MHREFEQQGVRKEITYGVARRSRKNSQFGECRLQRGHDSFRLFRIPSPAGTSPKLLHGLARPQPEFQTCPESGAPAEHVLAPPSSPSQPSPLSPSSPSPAP